MEELVKKTVTDVLEQRTMKFDPCYEKSLDGGNCMEKHVKMKEIYVFNKINLFITVIYTSLLEL